MEDLNKTQIVLLSLLVSFVGSVATSIITYSLLVEAPPAVTRTVNRVVERTIETVVPDESEPDVVTREVTVVVQEEDLIIDAISENKASFVRIWYDGSLEDDASAEGDSTETQAGTEATEEGKTFHSVALILDSEGTVVSPTISTSPDLSYEARMDDGSVVSLDYVFSSENFSFFKMSTLETEVVPATLGDSVNLQLGQTVVAIKGRDRNTVSLGRISELIEDGEQDIGPVLVKTDFSLEEGVKGGPVVNLKGEIIGFNVASGSSFIPVNVIKSDLAQMI